MINGVEFWKVGATSKYLSLLRHDHSINVIYRFSSISRSTKAILKF